MSLTLLAEPMAESFSRPTHEQLSYYARASRTPRLRTMREFAEQELVIPEGQFEGETFRPDRQPFAALLLDEIDSGRWYRVAVCGCVQAGKSLIGFDLPIMYHLFEVRETVVVGLPTQDLAWDKWTKEIRPAIAASRYASLIPTSGRGSRGGQFESIEFTNGASLKFMSGGGGDEKRSSYTARVVAITEADKMDQAGESSRETDPVSQIEARSLSWDYDQRRAFLECTVSIEEGRIWQEYVNGSESRIVCPCPHCRQWVTPERQHLEGWQAAETKWDARANAHFVCPACGGKIDDEARRTMNLRAKLLHRGQTIDEVGVVTGDLPKTDTLGFRWNAFNNLFWSIGAIGIAEWEAARGDLDSTEREMLQFYWARPYVPDQVDDTPLDWKVLHKRTRPYQRGEVPPSTQYLTLGIDVGKWLCYYVLLGWQNDRRGHVVEYGTIDVPSDQMGVEAGVVAALRAFSERVAQGWETRPGEVQHVHRVLVDSGYQPDSVHTACIGAGDAWQPSLGQGISQYRGGIYQQPKHLSHTIRRIGEQYHLSKLQGKRIQVVEFNADYWKSWAHQRLSVDPTVATAVTLFSVDHPREHDEFCRQVTAEKLVQDRVPGKGVVEKWINEAKRRNHYLDAYVLACVGSHLAGFRLVEGQEEKKQAGNWWGKQKG